MTSVLQSLSQYTPHLLLVLILALAALALAYYRLGKRIALMRAKWQDLLEGVRGDDLERLLELHFKERQEMRGELQDALERLELLEDRVQGSKQHLGLVRYDAFDDVSGLQSFTLALFDDKGDGAVISSLVGRSDCRVYCKPLLNGRSERTLSQEERRAIENARKTTPRSIVS